MLYRFASLATTFTTLIFAQTPALDHFEKKIRPVLASRCTPCHGSSAAAPPAGLLLNTSHGIQQGGRSGPVLVPGDPDKSLLIRAIRYTDKQLKMPPGNPLPPETVADFELWIREGASLPPDSPEAVRKKPVLWSLQKPRLAELPAVNNRSWIRNEIDAFVLQKLEAKGLEPSPEADKRTLIRRVTFDLIGLPPTAEEISRFVTDPSPQAYEHLIDRLLASPRYGERWGRHWLDVARYSDSVNDSVNAAQRYPWSYTYRDWVIRAFNEDLPYDRFLLYQLAADRVPSVDPRHLAALGFLSLGREFPKSFPETVDDRIDAVARGMMGMTVACARCHDHKFDPIPTADYYSFYSIFSNIRQPKDLPLLGKADPGTPRQALYQERLKHIRDVYQEYRVRRNAEQVAFFRTQIADYLVAAHDAEGLANPAIEELVRDRQLNLHVLERWRKYLAESRTSGEPVFSLWHAAAAIPTKQFADRWQAVRAAGKAPALVDIEVNAKPIASLKDLAGAYAAAFSKTDRVEPFSDPEAERLRAVVRGPKSPVDVPVEEFELIYTEGDSNNTGSMRVRYNTMLAQAAYDGAAPRAMSVEDLPDPKPAHVFLRGNPNNPGPLAPPHFLSCLDGSEQKVFQDGSGRLDLAQRIIDPDNPLTARVLVNRVWMHHFGAGLVRTPSDFGNRGEPPTHPELLDALAIRFVESGWSIKKLHRLILSSATYRQSSADSEAGRKIDPENQLLWRMNRLRLEIESLRDSMLAAAGRLDLTAGGPPFSLTAEPSVPRRSVYGLIERGKVAGVLNAFDFASPDQHAPMRFTTTVPQQALFFLNSPFVAEQSRALAARLDSAGTSDPSLKIRQLYVWAFGRDPEPRELNAGLKFVADAEDSAPAAGHDASWQYGIGEFQSATARVTDFKPFPVFVADRWQGGSVLPAGQFGKAVLRPVGGEPGEQQNQSVVLRWVSPVSGSIAIEGTLRHAQPAVPFGDGVRGRVVSSRLGELASWSVNGSSAETRMKGIAVQKGDVVDFIVDARSDPENDAFSWAPVIRVGDRTWNAKEDFAGPPPRRLGTWARYAQVLLETGEFAFID
jgi:hypothetical protein